MRVIDAVVERRRAGLAVYDLSAGQPSTPAPGSVRKAAHEALDTDLIGYTNALGIPQLREAIAGHYERTYAVAVAPRSVVVTTGSSGGFLFAFLAAWNDFFAPLILLTDPTKQPLPVAIANMRQQTMGVINYGATEAGVVVMAIPCVILFLLLQRYYVRGFMSGAVKG